MRSADTRGVRPFKPVGLVPCFIWGFHFEGFLATYSLNTWSDTFRRDDVNPLAESASRIVDGGTHWSIVSQKYSMSFFESEPPGPSRAANGTTVCR